MNCRKGELIRVVMTVLLLFLLSWLPAYADEGAVEGLPDAIEEVEQLTDEDVVQVDTTMPESGLLRNCPPMLHWDLVAGYRFWGTSGPISRLAPYDDVTSGPGVSLSLYRLGKDLKLSLDASLVTENDYQADLDLDLGSRYRFHAGTNSFRHNLLHLAPSGVDFSYIGSDGELRSYDYAYVPHSSTYHLDSTFNSGQFRYRLSNYPLHLNLRIWQFLQQGDRQLRYSDQVRGATDSYLFSQSRAVDTAVTEVSIGADGHFGYVDAIYSLVWRELDDRTSTPLHQYAERPELRSAGLQEHNAIPESRYVEQSVALHTSMTGRLVGAASYSVALRDNRGELADTSMSSRPEDRLQNGAADLNLTLSPDLSLVMRYRLLTVDKDGPDTVYNRWYLTNPISVRDGIDLRRNQLTTALLYRPLPNTTVKAEYIGEFQQRSNTGNWPLLDSSVEKHTGSLSIHSRPRRGLRLKASYAYTSASSDTYGASYDQRHDARFFGSYIASSTMPWGGSVSARIVDERNGAQLLSPYVDISLPRERSLANGTALIWLTPVPSLTLTANYGFNRNDADQTVLYEMGSNASAVRSNYRGEVSLIGFMASYQASEQISLSGGYQSIRSLGSLQPRIVEFEAGRDTSGIKDISRVDIREDVLSLRTEYRFSRKLSCNAEYALRVYESRGAAADDGTMHRISASLTSSW